MINAEFENYNREAGEKWGGTEAYREYLEKSKHYTDDKRDALIGEMSFIMSCFSGFMQNGAEPCSAEVQALVKDLQDHITENYYNCTDDILSGLGKMYVADERFKKNIDKGGAGTAEFVGKAIEIYCGK